MKSNPKIHSRAGECGDSEVGVGTWCTGPGSVLFNDWITSLSSRFITQSYNIKETGVNSLKPNKKVFFLLKEWFIISNKSGSTFFTQLKNYIAIPEDLILFYPNCLNRYHWKGLLHITKGKSGQVIPLFEVIYRKNHHTSVG